MDLQQLRAEFGVVAEGLTYLDHASMGPLPRRSADAITQLVQDLYAKGALAMSRWFPHVDRTRELVGQLLNVAPTDVAFVKNTSEGLEIIAAGLPWRAGDVIITAEEEFPANVYPWLSLQRRGVEVRFVPLRAGALLTEDVAAALDAAGDRARLLVLSWVQYHNGARCDVAALSALCRERGVIFGLDAIQGVGVLPLDLSATPVDFCAFGCQKWMLSPQGSGVLTVSADLRSQLSENVLGWLGADWGDFSRFDYERPIKETAARFEEGTRVLLAIAGLEQSLGLFLELGVETIAAHLEQLTGTLLAHLDEMGAQVRTPRPWPQRSGIVSFTLPGVESAALFEALKAERIVVSLRQGAIRVSPHAYTSPEEIELLVDVVRRAATS